MKDIFIFHKNFYKKPDKICQDNYIVKHLQVTPIQRRRPRDNTKCGQRKFTVKYKIYSRKTKQDVTVCKQTFLSALRINAGRVEGVSKRFGETRTMPQENRGGDRKAFLFASRREAVQNFVKKFQPLESHYSRDKVKQRVYLAPELNIKKMWRMYEDEALPGFEVSLGFFRKVFNTSFNIGFGSPRKDVCSDCLQLLERIKLTNSERDKQELRTQYRIHKIRAKCYFQYLRDDSPDVQIVSFDCQKNLPLPKIPDQSVYYSRQLYLYNLTIVVGNSKSSLTPENVHAYVWTEEQAAKGANEICSCVYHCLNNLNLEGKTKLRLVADGCGGQNKNAMLITMTIKWLDEVKHRYPDLTEIQIIFPVTGHSFIPPYRAFALTEQVIKRRESIIEPREYTDIIAEHATIHKVSSDIPVLDWKTQRAENLKSSMHFQISKCKRIILTRQARNKIKVRGEISYRNDLGQDTSVFKKGRKVSQITPSVVAPGHLVKPDKLQNVKNLLQKHFGQERENVPQLGYYKRVLAGVIPVDHEEENDEQVTNLPEYEMEEVLDFV